MVGVGVLVPGPAEAGMALGVLGMACRCDALGTVAPPSIVAPSCLLVWALCVPALTHLVRDWRVHRKGEPMRNCPPPDHLGWLARPVSCVTARMQQGTRIQEANCPATRPPHVGQCLTVHHPHAQTCEPHTLLNMPPPCGNSAGEYASRRKPVVWWPEVVKMPSAWEPTG